MPTIYHEIFIQAPIETCFNLCRDVQVHAETAAHTKERVISEHTTDLLEVEDIVTFEAIHFGIKQQLTAKITEMEKPYYFIDEMVEGAFQSFIHTHEFKEIEAGTVMIDHFVFETPYGLIGKLANYLFLKNYMERFIHIRAVELKNRAESIKA